jgi:hypothetical protein
MRGKREKSRAAWPGRMFLPYKNGCLKRRSDNYVDLDRGRSRTAITRGTG